MKSILVGMGAAAMLVCAGQACADGKDVYEQVCSKCHRTGLNGAPKAGNKTAWEPRVKAGLESLYHSALNGKNEMPAKGGKERLSDDEVKSAVEYLVGLAGLIAEGGGNRGISSEAH
jgi:cytochrome c5